MDYSNHRIDEYTLAAFLAGTLSEEEREEVVAFLAKNGDARELLCMAQQGLEAARRPEELPAAPERPARRAGAPVRGKDRSGRRRQPRLTRFLVATVVVLTMGLGLRLALGPPTDALRSTLPGQTTELSARVLTSPLQFQWNVVEEALQYRLVVWDPQQARVVARHTTTETSITEDDEFLRDIRGQLDANRSYALRIDAVDAQNRLIQSSEPVNFTLEP